MSSFISEQVLVLGANGFIGSTICQYLRNQSIPFSAPTRQECDLLNLAQTQSYLKQFEQQQIKVVLGAAIPRRVTDSPEAMQRNIQMVSNFIQGADTRVLKSLIFLSSIDVYGTPKETPITESILPAPNSFYAVAKTCGEYLLKEAWPSIPLTILRLPGIYGKGDNGNSIVSMFAQKIQERATLTLTNNGTSLRDYVTVMDLCKFIYRLLQNPYAGTFNFATGKSMTIVSIAQLIAKYLGSRTNIAFVEKDNTHFDICLSNRKLCEVFPDFSCTSMESGIRNYISELVS